MPWFFKMLQKARDLKIMSVELLPSSRITKKMKTKRKKKPQLRKFRKRQTLQFRIILNTLKTVTFRAFWSSLLKT
jgi:hypothetical protein